MLFNGHSLHSYHHKKKTWAMQKDIKDMLKESMIKKKKIEEKER
jgi:hypothetical protein